MANRREFLKLASLSLAMPLILGCKGGMAAADGAPDELLAAIKKNAIMDPECSWCGARDAPSNVSWRTVLAAPADEGERLTISGTVYKQDGRSPAPDTLIYLYHTDVHGLYGRKGQHRHGKHRGWMLTDASGRYEFDSIIPASYPDSTIAKHIHMTVTGRDFREDWIDSILFEGDRFITAMERVPRKGGFNPILKLSRSPQGVMLGVRDIRLA